MLRILISPDRLLTRAAQKGVPSHDRQGVVGPSVRSNRRHRLLTRAARKGVPSHDRQGVFCPNVRKLGFAVLFAVAAHAGVWPQQIGKSELKSEHAVQVTADRDLWDEYGLVSATEGDYGSFQATAYRFKDATDAFAAGQWLATPDPPMSVVAGNYVIICRGSGCRYQELAQLSLPNQRHGEVPLVWAYLPSKGLIAHSGRYALGPVGLKQFAPQIPASAAAFDVGTEVTTARYRTPKGEEQLILLSFPISQMARQQLGELRKLPGAAIRQSGPLVAVVTNPQDPSAVERLLSQINYQAQVNRDEVPPPKVTAQGVANMVLTIFKLAGLLILFCLFAGLGFAGLRVVRKRLGYESADEAMIVLHLADR
jgi:hypothetical protein